jgi:hypothetical protein
VIRRPASPSRSPRALAAAAAATAAIGLTGCAELSLQATTLEYDPADGVSAKVGSVALQDVMLIAPERAGGKAQLSGMAENPTGAPIEVTVGTTSSGGQKFTVPARGVVRLDGKASGDSTERIAPVEVSNIKNKVGESAKLAFTSPAAGQVQVSVPILLDQYPYGTETVDHPTAEGGEGGGH